MTRFNLSLLTNDVNKMLEWLGCDGSRPDVAVPKTKIRLCAHCGQSLETVPVTDEESLRWWWGSISRGLWDDFKLPERRSWDQLQMESCSLLGIKHGNLKARLSQARQRTANTTELLMLKKEAVIHVIPTAPIVEGVVQKRKWGD